MDIGFHTFNLYLIVLIFSIVVSVMAVIKRNCNSLSWSVVLFFACIIGLSCSYPVWVRVASGLYNIEWNG